MPRSEFSRNLVRRLLAQCARHRRNLDENVGSFSDNLAELRRKQMILAGQRRMWAR